MLSPSIDITIKKPPFRRCPLENVTAVLGSLEERRLFKSRIGSKHTRQRLSVCFCHRGALKDDNRCGGMAPAGAELHLFHVALQLGGAAVPYLNAALFTGERGKKKKTKTLTLHSESFQNVKISKPLWSL